MNYKLKTRRLMKQLKDSIVIDDGTKFILELVKQNIESIIRITFELDKEQERKILDYKKIGSLCSTRSGLQKNIILIIDRLEFKENSDQGLAGILKELGV